MVPSRSVRKSLPGCCFSSFFPLVQQVPSLQPWQGLSELGYRYQSMRERDTSYRPVRVGRELGSEGVHREAGWDGLSSQGQSQVSAVFHVPTGNVGKTSSGWSEGPGIQNQTPLGAGGRGTAAKAGLLAQMAAAWLLHCSMAAPPGRWCAWQILRSCLPMRRQPRRARSRALRLAVLGKGLDAAPEGRFVCRTSGAFAAALGNGVAVN